MLALIWLGVEGAEELEAGEAEEGNGDAGVSLFVPEERRQVEGSLAYRFESCSSADWGRARRHRLKKPM